MLIQYSNILINTVYLAFYQKGKAKKIEAYISSDLGATVKIHVLQNRTFLSIVYRMYTVGNSMYIKLQVDNKEVALESVNKYNDITNFVRDSIIFMHNLELFSTSYKQDKEICEVLQGIIINTMMMLDNCYIDIQDRKVSFKYRNNVVTFEAGKTASILHSSLTDKPEEIPNNQHGLSRIHQLLT